MASRRRRTDRSDGIARPPDPRHAAGPCAGLTLVELLVAVAILGLAVTTLLYLRTSAIDRVGRAARQRLIQRLAQEKLDEIVFGVEEAIAGDFADKGRPDWSWESQETIQQIGDEILLERTLVVTVRPQGAVAEEGIGEETYELSCWSLPDAAWYEVNADLFDEEGRYVPPEQVPY